MIIKSIEFYTFSESPYTFSNLFNISFYCRIILKLNGHFFNDYIRNFYWYEPFDFHGDWLSMYPAKLAGTLKLVHFGYTIHIDIKGWFKGKIYRGLFLRWGEGDLLCSFRGKFGLSCGLKANLLLVITSVEKNLN